MTRRLLFTLLLLISASAALAHKIGPSKSTSEKEQQATSAEFNPKNWKRFSSTDGGFSVLFPTPPNAETKQLTLPMGTVTMQLFIARTNGEYGVVYADYSFSIEGTERLVPFMDAVQDAGVQGINGQVLDQNEILFAGHPGRFYRVEFGGGYVMNAKMLVVKNRLYLVTATTYGKKAAVDVARVYEKFAKRFLDSFRLTSAEDPKPPK
jgi:hypothetical protein